MLRFSALLFATSFAVTMPASAKDVFDVKDVVRETVPAGTPAAFEVAFKNAVRNTANRQVEDQSYAFVPLQIIPLKGETIALISTGASDCTGHACSGLNAVHYLAKNNGGGDALYKVTGEWMDIGATGTFGNPATRWGWSNAVADVPVLYTEGGGTWQGYSCSFASLTALTPEGPVQLASIPIVYSDSSKVDSKETLIEGRITAAKKGSSFKVSYSGSKTFSETYVRGSDGHYTLKGQSRVPTC